MRVRQSYKWYLIYKVIFYVVMASVWIRFMICLRMYGSKDIVPDEKYLQERLKLVHINPD